MSLKARLAGLAGGFALVALTASPAWAGDAVIGRQKAAACTVCHGVLGLANAPEAPNLAGQSALYVSAQLKAYRNGTRQHEVMSLMAKGLSDADIDNLAAWYESLKVSVAPVP